MAKRTILVTGCSDGGLGSALALALHQAGWRVFATARNPRKMSSLKSAGIETLTLDVLSDQSRSDCVAATAQLTGGTLDALVNNAGAGLSMPVADISVEEGRKMFDINVWSLVSVTQAFLPMLMKAEHGSLIVNHTSVAGVFGVPFQAAYNASKAAAIMLSDGMRLELAPFGIKVVDLRTGIVSSNFYANIKENELSTKLPDDSIYQIAREAVEETLIGVIDGQRSRDRGQPAAVWAKEVAADLSKKKTPAVMWRGSKATQVWLSTFLPFGTLDSKVKQMTHIDKVEEAVKKRKQSK